MRGSIKKLILFFSVCLLIISRIASMLQTGRIPWYWLAYGFVSGSLILGPFRWLIDMRSSDESAAVVIIGVLVTVLILAGLVGGFAKIVFDSVFVGTAIGFIFVVFTEIVILPEEYSRFPDSY